VVPFEPKSRRTCARFRRTASPSQPPAPIVATPFTWRAEAEIPRGNGSTASTCSAASSASTSRPAEPASPASRSAKRWRWPSGRDLYGIEVHDGPLNVWLYNLEDPAEESERRIHATAKWFNIAPEDVDGRLYVDSGRDQRCVIATETEYGARIAQPVYEQIKAQLPRAQDRRPHHRPVRQPATRSARTTTARSTPW
jgi:hypothetical protein